jgi:hypothetical protein
VLILRGHSREQGDHVPAATPQLSLADRLGLVFPPQPQLAAPRLAPLECLHGPVQERHQSKIDHQLARSTESVIEGIRIVEWDASPWIIAVLPVAAIGIIFMDGPREFLYW